MGLIKALAGAAGGVLADQWLEFFTCDSIPQGVLVVKGQKTSNLRSSNTKGSDNIITNGSGIAVNEGQAMIIVDNGKIVEFCAEPGQFTYDSSTEPSVFAGGLGAGIVDSFKRIGGRFTYGGDTGHDQRVYYFNTKEILDNKYGTPTPVQYKAVDADANLKMLIRLRCNGVYSFRIIDPILFYTNVCSNVTDQYTRDQLEPQMKSELLTALQPAFGTLSAQHVDYTEIPLHTMELAESLNQILSEKWRQFRGIEIVNFGINSIAALPEDEEKMQQMQLASAMRGDYQYQDALRTSAAAEAMRTAAANENGVMSGFMGVGMAGMAMGGMGYGAPAGSGQPMQQGYMQQAALAQAPAPTDSKTASANVWTCSCGTQNSAKFCHECGSPRPVEASGWVCSCGNLNKGKFCAECGSPKPAAALLYKCDKCGWESDDPARPSRFCPECGNPFGDGDIVS